MLSCCTASIAARMLVPVAKNRSAASTVRMPNQRARIAGIMLLRCARELREWSWRAHSTERGCAGCPGVLRVPVLHAARDCAVRAPSRPPRSKRKVSRACGTGWVVDAMLGPLRERHERPLIVFLNRLPDGTAKLNRFSGPRPLRLPRHHARHCPPRQPPNDGSTPYRSATPRRPDSPALARRHGASANCA